MTTHSKPPTRVGVLLQGRIQFLDVASVDLLNILTPSFLRTARLSEEVIKRVGVNFEFVYIGEVNEGAGPITAGGKLHVQVNI